MSAAVRAKNIRVLQIDGGWMWCAQHGARHAAGGCADTREQAEALAKKWIEKREGETQCA